jgi:NADH-ubiquinone oxidoreductase chain 2
LTYFLLGGLSSCFILLGSGLFYRISGLTSLEGLYVFYNIMPESGNFYSNIALPLILVDTDEAIVEIFSIGFLIISSGYLFKVSAAPFHF